MTERLLGVRETLTPADHQTHRPYVFEVPPGCRELQLWIRYVPKRLSEQESLLLAEAALAEQSAALAARVGEPLAARWLASNRPRIQRVRISNLLTPSLDDAETAYRGAGHRHADDQHLRLGLDSASPGLVAGPLPAGSWTLTISVHTLVSAQCELSIQIDAEMASRR